MRTLIKILSSIIGVMILLIIIITLTIIFIINPNSYKPQIINLVKNETGRELTIDSNIQLSFFPWLGFEVGSASLSNATGFQEPSFAKIAHAKMQIKMVPLFKKQLEIDTILVEGVELNLTRRADGHNNWEDLLKKETSTATNKIILPFNISGIELSQAKVIWDDQTTQTALHLSDLHLQTGMIVLNQPIQIQLTSQFEYKKIQSLQGKIDLNTQLLLDLEKQSYQLNTSQMIVDLQGENIPNRQQKLTFSSPQIKTDLKQQNVQLEWQAKLAGQEDELTLKGTMQVNQLLTQPLIQGQLQLNEFNLQKWTKQLGLPMLALPKNLAIQTVSLATQFIADVNKVDLENVQLKIDENTLTIPKVKFNLVENNLDLTSFSLQALSSTLTGQFEVEQLLTAQPTINGTLDLTANPQEVLKRLGQSLPALPTPLAKASLKMGLQGNLQQLTLSDLQLMVDEQQLNIPQIQMDIAKDQITVDHLTVKAFGLTAQGNLLAHLFRQPLGITAQFKVNPFDPRLLLKQFNQTIPQMSDKNALKSLALETQLETNLSDLSLKNLNIQLDNNLLQGTVTLQNFKKPATVFELQLGSLDVDRYLPPKAVKKVVKTEKTPEKPLATTTTPLLSAEMLQKLQALNLEGSLKIADLKIAGVKMTDIQLIISGKEGKVTVLPKMNLYQGHYDGHFLLDVQNNPPHFYLDDTLNQVQIGRLLTDLIGKNLMSGTTDATIKMDAEMTTLENLQKTLAGTFNFKLIDGTLQGINIGYALRKVKAILKKQSPPANEPLKTDFSSLQGTLVAKEGILYNDNLDVKSPLLRMKGQGHLVMSTQQLDVLLETAIVETATGQGGKELADLKGITIPLRITGVPSQPEVKPDLQAIQTVFAERAKTEALNKLEEEKRKLLEKNKEKIPEDVRKLLDSFDLKNFVK
ncbi:MAG: hypothetical protein BWK79_10215 [Beggiatoa sp. IS2]|nr:MAG: hypothetical protein BWK79_10215 [Beggiatoa sp. IS2]